MNSSLPYPHDCTRKRMVSYLLVLVALVSLLMPSCATTIASSSISVTTSPSPSSVQATLVVTSNTTQALPASSSSRTTAASASVATPVPSPTAASTPSSVQSTLVVTSSSTQALPASSSSGTTATSASVATPVPSPTAASTQVQVVSSVAVDPCKTNNGGCSHNCISIGTEYNCTCDSGFKLETDLHNCTDFDECNGTSPDEHKCAHICVNTVGSYGCACRPGYKLQMDGLKCKKELTTPSPTSKRAEHDWTWIILGLVIGLVILSIVILVFGAISKRVLGSEHGKEGIAGSNTHEMTAVKTTRAGMANPAVDTET